VVDRRGDAARSGPAPVDLRQKRSSVGEAQAHVVEVWARRGVAQEQVGESTVGAVVEGDVVGRVRQRGALIDDAAPAIVLACGRDADAAVQPSGGLEVAEEVVGVGRTEGAVSQPRRSAPSCSSETT